MWLGVAGQDSDALPPASADVARASLIYAIAVESVPWLPCPLTLAEAWLEARAVIEPARRPFLVRVLDAVVYPRAVALLSRDEPKQLADYFLFSQGSCLICALTLARTYHSS